MHDFDLFDLEIGLLIMGFVPGTSPKAIVRVCRFWRSCEVAKLQASSDGIVASVRVGGKGSPTMPRNGTDDLPRTARKYGRLTGSARILDPLSFAPPSVSTFSPRGVDTLDEKN